MLIPKSILFVSGAVTIALEIVASRIMVPYFGASLFVWTAILTVTLLSLAVGYAFGGRITRIGQDRVRLSFSLFPALAGLGLIAGVLAFPILPHLAAAHLIAGAFAAATILLAPCLILLSALNPLVVALPGRSATGDAGSGSVFALSTVGSVAGALIASFALVPFLPVDWILLALAGGLSLCSALAALTRLSGAVRATALGASLLVLAGTAAMPRALPAPTSVSLAPGVTARHVATYRSDHGNVSVVELTADHSPGRRLIGYVQNGGLQGMIHADGRIATPYARVMLDALRAYRPEARRVLVIGLATGMMPRELDERGVAVDVVDINPDSPAIARRHFGFIPKKARVHILDARLFLDGCAGAGYDAILVDAFSGLEPPEHLLTIEAFEAAASCLKADGLLLVNLIMPPAHVGATKAILSTVQAALPGPMHLFSLAKTTSRYDVANQILIAGPGVPALPPTLAIADYPTDFVAFEPRMLSGRTVARGDTESGVLLTDRHNPFAFLAAQAQATRGVIPFPVGW